MDDDVYEILLTELGQYKNLQKYIEELQNSPVRIRFKIKQIKRMLKVLTLDNS